MLPLSVIKAAISNPIQVELKNGETFNGYLKGCDVFMNLYITDVIRTSKDGETFYRLAEAHIRGTMIKLLNIPDEVMEKVKDEEELKRNEKRHFYGRGRGRGHANEGNEEAAEVDVGVEAVKKEEEVDVVVMKVVEVGVVAMKAGEVDVVAMKVGEVDVVAMKAGEVDVVVGVETCTNNHAYPYLHFRTTSASVIYLRSYQSRKSVFYPFNVVNTDRRIAAVFML
eukprot:CAMPEP_0175086568 /NCGR_PEP_ID=MMETSP0052_2-20121109/29320_1 /TAXON_ID=51329 ORGANISM="Polytomella parva, Strain SAG 63-3" /NCGR_SAMPLE_ID=MMETSP0052_2 /ASSEMBLY_ACC=CAM_ASM_000194 /LENGTH=224 /DNA_ID=CAMNT_0016358763 /DNA_START=15 /DNA_END=690 /DNA_ORIENTATION=-